MLVLFFCQMPFAWALPAHTKLINFPEQKCLILLATTSLSYVGWTGWCEIPRPISGKWVTWATVYRREKLWPDELTVPNPASWKVMLTLKNWSALLLHKYSIAEPLVKKPVQNNPTLKCLLASGNIKLLFRAHLVLSIFESERCIFSISCWMPFLYPWLLPFAVFVF